MSIAFSAHFGRSDPEAGGKRPAKKAIACRTGVPMEPNRHRLGDLLHDESGAQVLEYALIIGLLIVAAIAAISSVGVKVLARWTSLNNSM